MHYTDEEIIEILIAQKKAKLRKERRRKRRNNLIMLSIVLVLFMVLMGILIKVTINYVSENREKARAQAAAEQSAEDESKAVKNGGVIFIDPGHGGSDPGAETSKRQEKKDTLKIARLLKEDLEKKGYKVYMSRSTDTDVDRQTRGKMANNKNADLFVSIHRNTGDAGSETAATASGTEVWIKASNQNKSRLLGSMLLNELDKSDTIGARQVKAGTLTDRNDDYYENSVPSMPSCLIELGFMTNKKDNEAIDKKADRVAAAMASGIDKTYKAIKTDKVNSYSKLMDKYRPDDE
ncbi:N-acetylmuramoyl-L-alanine amidase [Clostridiales Family XIII bacterium RF-744-FAT-WT-3]|uniref:N-acetylmuramoyl-L-alanine amidase n=1 Tax=Baileyella intestinalis TaxID=2606709 RepID=A0A6A8M7E7_9FIRM|nr:N-acetylmuramoyl-L-alanine amidase [Baileyella intestinalis]MST68219.1 N-acetylmuramoyl-L-alanine amidase [Baileyella intestinalis]